MYAVTIQNLICLKMHLQLTKKRRHAFVASVEIWPILVAWFNFNPNMEK